MEVAEAETFAGTSVIKFLELLPNSKAWVIDMWEYYNENVNNTILENAKQMVIDQNPGQPDIADKLFMDLGEQFQFEQSLQPFYSTSATTIPNDQAGFADFCYGSMVSCKEGNLFACARNLDRYTN